MRGTKNSRIHKGDLKRRLNQARCEISIWLDVVYKRIFVLDVDEFKRETRGPDAPQFGSPGRPPPATLVSVTRLSDPDLLIEIDLLAITDE